MIDVISDLISLALDMAAIAIAIHAMRLAREARESVFSSRASRLVDASNARASSQALAIGGAEESEVPESFSAAYFPGGDII
jgi:hypothetical protein